MIRAVLFNAVWVGKQVYATIYCDRSGKFKDGHTIRTTDVQVQRGNIIVTQNSMYLVAHWAGANAQRFGDDLQPDPQGAWVQFKDYDKLATPELP